MEVTRKLQPLDLRQLEERLEVSALSGGIMGEGLIEGDCIICCYHHKCDRIIPLLLTMLAREREALAGLWAGDQQLLAPGRRFLAEHPELRSGLVLSFHQGPFPLLVEPYLAAGLDPVILLHPSARENFREMVEQSRAVMGHKGKVRWSCVGEKGFIRQLIKAVREGAPVIAFIDGNSGESGMDGTRRDGALYSLPGRDIKVRTGLARLVCRLQCPMHMAAVHWNERMEMVWEAETDQTPAPTEDPEAVTRRIFDWVFSQIMARPEQWDFWIMLREACACFSPALGADDRLPAGLHDDFIHAFHICLERSASSVRLHLDRQVEVWPGDVLVNLTDDRFYSAEGLRDQDLETMREAPRSLEELSAEHGLHWVKFHGLRLCLLGMARLGA
ncbi:hypothetical protein CSA17_00490 [bacterium DOLJORAL78_65_58]|nr:MAG: hypothetical protein CSA17_00490 [bacterium DOLJORAL78_65_58]